MKATLVSEISDIMFRDSTVVYRVYNIVNCKLCVSKYVHNFNFRY